MTGRRAFALASLACLLAGPAALASPSSVDALLDRAKHERYDNHNTAAAAKLVAQALKIDPKNFRARYTQGLLQNDQGDTAGAIRTLTAVIQDLGGKPAPDPAIYNTLGWFCMSQGDTAAAEHWYLVGYADKARLKPDSRQKLLNNLGNLYLIKGDKASAARYFAESASSGNRSAQVILPKVRSLPTVQSARR